MKDTNNKKSLVRSSSAEYLTFIAATGEGGVDAIYSDENIWLSQKMMSTLYNVDVRTINEHLKNIFKDNELQEDSVIRKYRITATDGKNYNTQHYNLSAIIAVGYKVSSDDDGRLGKSFEQIYRSYRQGSVTKRRESNRRDSQSSC